MRFLFLFFLTITAITTCAQQSTSITGFQERIPSQNAELSCNPVTITRNMVIDSVSGFHNGFWIVKNNKTEKAFWTERFAKNSIGYLLLPGTYSVYPNLKADSDTASVTIWLRKK